MLPELAALPTYLLGLDLAQSQDWTALSVVEQHPDASFDVVHLDRWQGESYTAVVPRVAAVEAQIRDAYRERQYERLGSLDHTVPAPQLTLVVDATGVGRPIVDNLRDAGLSPIAVTITGGDQVIQPATQEFRTPKRDLVASVAVLLEHRRLRVAQGLALAGTLRHELDAFRRTRSPRGHDRYEAGPDTLSWREQPHDDLVLSVALAAWYGSRGAAAGTLGPADPDLVAAMADLLAVR